MSSADRKISDKLLEKLTPILMESGLADSLTAVNVICRKIRRAFGGSEMQRASELSRNYCWYQPKSTNYKQIDSGKFSPSVAFNRC